MKRWTGLALVAALIMTASGFAQDAAPVANPYYPLKTGNEWTYAVQGGPVKVKVTGTENIKETTCYKLETSVGGKASSTESVGVTKEGVQRFVVNGISADIPILFLKADAKKGDTWTVDTKVAGQAVKGTFKVDEAKIKVKEKEYETLHVKTDDMEIGSTKTSVEYWFAKDVGIVKLKFSLGTQEATLELEAFTPAK